MNIDLSASPNLAFVLLALGIVGIYIEFLRPGTVLPGALGGLVAVVALYNLLQAPFSWAAAGLMLGALLLMAGEALLWPASRGFMGAAGAAALASGARLLLTREPRIRLSTAIAVALPFATLTVFLLVAAVRARTNKMYP